MNLMHLLAKKDRNLIVGDGITPFKRRMGERIFSGLMLPPGQAVRLKKAPGWYPLNLQPTGAGWLASARIAGTLAVTYETQGGEIVGSVPTTITSQPGAVMFPFIPAGYPRAAVRDLDLVVTNRSTDGVDLWISETLPPALLYDQATGTGVEIGPGPNPRLTATAGREIYYLERETADEFQRKYGFTGKFASLESEDARAFWSQVVVGRANDIPFQPDTLDFIFSGDVLEHLVNPLGHLDYWARLLRAGGRVLAIVPHISGCSDYVNRPTPITDWIAQFEAGGFEETIAHHRPFAAARGLDPAVLFEKQYSSHFSFFNTENLTSMLDFAVDNLGYHGYNIYYGTNSKKIYLSVFKQ